MSKWWCAFLAVLLLGTRTSDGFLLATPPYALSFPRDHYAHDEYRTEWWYYTGHLQTRDGRRFGYELTFFRIGLQPRAHSRSGQSAWHSAQLYPAHFAVTDVTNGRFIYNETFARDALGQGSASQTRFAVRANGWSLIGTPERRSHMRLHAADNGSVLDLSLVPQKDPAIHGHGGVSQKASCVGCASHYYSYSRLQTTGTLVYDGTRFAVTGLSWMDHEFGSDELQPQQSGWDWFSIQLSDGREVMLYRLRERGGATTPQSSGSIVARDGRVAYIPLRDFSIDATSQWRSPHTGATYPARWTIRVAGLPELHLTPSVADQELANANGTTYWEGDARVSDAGGHDVGVAYVELTGYAGALRL